MRGATVHARVNAQQATDSKHVRPTTPDAVSSVATLLTMPSFLLMSMALALPGNAFSGHALRVNAERSGARRRG